MTEKELHKLQNAIGKLLIRRNVDFDTKQAVLACLNFHGNKMMSNHEKTLEAIIGVNDPRFEDVKDIFYSNFCPDDWDFIIIGRNEIEVNDLAYRLAVYDYCVKQIDDQWIGVTYHS